MKLIKSLIKKYFRTFYIFYTDFGYKIFLIVLISIVIGILDGIGLAMFLPLLQFADPGTNANPETLGKMASFVSFFEARGLKFDLKFALILMILFFILKGIVSYLGNIYKLNSIQKYIAKLRIQLISLLDNITFSKFISSNIGHIQNTFTVEVPKVSIGLQNYMTIMQGFILVLVYSAFAFYIDYKFALLISIGGALINLIFKVIYKKTKILSKKVTEKNGIFQGLIIQFINNYKYLKSTGKNIYYKDVLKNSVTDIENVNKSILYLSNLSSVIREPLIIIIVAIVIYIQIYLFNGNLATILVSLLFFYRALTSLMSTQTSYNTFLAQTGAIENNISFVKELKGSQAKNGKTTFDTLRHKIEIKNLEFRFDDNTKILDNINLTIARNETIAFVGESGSGKTTLTNVLTGLFPPSSGNVIVDNVDLNEIEKNSYRSRIGYISQEAVIFNSSIYENITLWADKTPDNIAKFWDVVQKTSLYNLINDLQNKENTELGNNGINLSGGQRQRISIARELFKDCDILILDEATSALDSETEKSIQENIDLLKGKLTIIIIAHRLSTVKDVDTIYILNKGTVLDSGKFEDLYNKSSTFKKMVELQAL